MLTELDLNLASNAKMSAIIITERFSYPLDYFNDVVDARLKFSLYSMLYLKKFIRHLRLKNNFTVIISAKFNISRVDCAHLSQVFPFRVGS